MYLTVQEVRDEGLTDYTDEQIEKAIEVATSFIDNFTHRWFENRTAVIVEHGGDRLIQFDNPIISISSVAIDEYDFVDYDVYADLHNPHIILNNVGQYRTAIITGEFGYLENGETPKLIKRACMKMVKNYAMPIYSDEAQELDFSQNVVKEKTDEHSYELGKGHDEKLINTITGDYELDTILTMYSKVFGIGSA